MFRFAWAYQAQGVAEKFYLAAGTSAGIEVEPVLIGLGHDQQLIGAIMHDDEFGLGYDQQEVALSDEE